MSKEKQNTLIAQNRKARHEYFIEDTVEAGVKLQGWEVKSLRAGKGQLTDCYVVFKDSEVLLVGSHIQPLISAGTHVETDPERTRKLLLNRREIERLKESVQQKGYTCVALSLQWKAHLVKCTIGLAKGKKNHDKRETLKARDADRQMQSAMKAAR